VSVIRRALTTGAAALFAVGIWSGPAWAWEGGNGGGGNGGGDHHRSEPTVTSIAKGLDNPRDLALGPWGGLYVAEAGHGADPGSKECIPGGPEESTCVGFTSAISRIDRWGVHKVVSGLVSLAEPGGFFALGTSGVAASGWDLTAIEAESSDALPPEASKFLSAQTIERARSQLGRLIQVGPFGHYRVVADVGHFDFQWTAEHKELVPEQFPDANPYGVISSPWSTWVVDAGANTLDRVSPDGSVSVTTFFPNPPVSDAVPTCIDRGRDGAFYVGELTGGGNKPGASVVWRVVPGQAPTVWASGLTAVTGCGFGTDGQFYAVEFSTLGLDKAAPETGAVVRVPANSTSPTPIVSKLSFPNGFAAGWDRALYVSNWSVAPANSGGGPTGEVLRIAFQGHED
jgi:hypothetical protein